MQALEATVRVYGYSGWNRFLYSEYRTKIWESFADYQIDEGELIARRRMQSDRMGDYLALDAELARDY